MGDGVPSDSIATVKRVVPRKGWLKRLVLPAGLAGIETCWIYPWGLFVGLLLEPSNQAPLLSAMTVFVLLFVSQSIARMILSSNWPLARARLVLVVAGLVAVVIAVRIDHYGQVGLRDATWIVALASAFPSAFTNPSLPVWGLILAVLLWWHGITHGRDAIKHHDVQTAFRLGIVLLTLFLLVSAVVRSPALVQATAATCVVGFFLASLISLSLARLEDIRGQNLGGDGKTIEFNRQWMTVVLALVASMLVVALGLGQVLSFDVISAVASPLLQLLDSVVTLLIYAIALPVGLLIEVLAFLIRLIAHPGAPLSPQMPDMSVFGQAQAQGGWRQLPPEVVMAIKWTITGLAGLLVLALMVRSVFRWRKFQRDEEVAEERDSVWTWESLRSALLAWLHFLFRRQFASEPPCPTASELGPEPATVQPSSVLSIRQIYRELLHLGASVGVPRAGHATPYEHLPQLQVHLDPKEDLAAITEVYVQARYGADAPPDTEVEDARTRWQRVAACAEAKARQSIEQGDG